MKKLIAIFTILLVAVIFSGCKKKSPAIDKNRPFEIVGLTFTVDTHDGKYNFPMYKDSSLHYYSINPIEYLADGMKCQILSYNNEHESAYIKGKKNEGWVPVRYISAKFDKETLFWCIKAALEGNENARIALNFNFDDLTIKEAMDELHYIVDYVGVDRMKNIMRYSVEDLVILTAIARLIELSSSNIPSNAGTNPIHLLAEVANEVTWEYLDDSNAYTDYAQGYSDNYLQYFYRKAFLDDEAVSAQIHAIKAGNLDTLKYFYEHNIPNYYFAKIYETYIDDKKKIFSLMMSTKDYSGKSLADYVAECKDERIKNFMSMYEPAKCLSVNECLEYLRANEDCRNFQTLKVLYAPLPYTTYKVLNFEGNNTFVYLTDEDTLMAYDENLNIRDKPGKNGKVIGKLPYGTKVTVHDCGNEKVTIDNISDFWYKVSAKDLEGWCFGGYLANPVKYETLEELKGDDEYLNSLYRLRHGSTGGYVPRNWLYQAEFETKTPIVIKETKLLSPRGEDITAKPFEKVQILGRIEGNPDEDLWDYGMQDTNYERQYFYRYNYYLVRTQNYQMGIIGGSSLVYDRMSVTYDGPDVPVGGCESPYDIYYRLLYNPEPTEDYYNPGLAEDDYKVSSYAELYEVNYQTLETHRLETGYEDGPGFELEPVFLGNTYEGRPEEIEFIAYRDFDMKPYDFWGEATDFEPFYTFIFRTTLYGDNVSYNAYTVKMKRRLAFHGLYRDSYNTTGGRESYYSRYSYCYFESKNRNMPQCIFGEYDTYSDRSGHQSCHSHTGEHLALESISMQYQTIKSENLDYVPEW
ncbi:SH3 domain-containing protein [Treponema sp. C6A8]|uniref:SH3 domain-containing protein n=1 Tax=Treponema sp. C6A8 TaxID=1410609 RepID=UPI000570E12E|nr:SH3 domain-containing protein [Treponema sp. C6A8]